MESQVMNTQHASRGLTQGNDGIRASGPPPGTRSARSVRWIRRAMSAGLLTAATIIGVQFGMDAPSVSPVSPPAIAQQAALLPGGADEAQAMPVGQEDGHHQRRGRR